jgi:hypothetical protein
MHPDRQLIEDIVRQMFDCLRNGHLCLARGDPQSAHASVAEARALHRRLAIIAGSEQRSAVADVMIAVCGERIEGLAALTRQQQAD